MKKINYSSHFWRLGKNRFIRFAATDARHGIGFSMGGIHPMCWRLDRVGVMRKVLSRFATKGFVKKPLKGKMN